MWVQLRTVKNMEISGVMRSFQPGDWVEIGKSTAHLWISRGEAVAPGLATGKAPATVVGVGAVVKAGQAEAAKEFLDMEIREAEEGAPWAFLPFQYNILWDTTLEINAIFFEIGVGFLERWEIAAPLYDYKTLACMVGSEEEREKTKAVVRDLRVSMYDTRLIFARKTANTVMLMDAWGKEEGEERKLAFLRALYTVKPFILALPATWAGWDYAR